MLLDQLGRHFGASGAGPDRAGGTAQRFDREGHRNGQAQTCVTSSGASQVTQ